MEIQQIVLLEMKPGKRYDSTELSELTGLSVQQTRQALKRLHGGMILERDKKGRRYEYWTKQQQLNYG